MSSVVVRLAREMYSGNGGAGVFLLGAGTTLNRIQGNLIGTDILGRDRLQTTFRV